MKRCLTLLLALVLTLSLAACGAKSAGPDTMTGDYNGYESTKEDYDFSATDDEAEDAGAWNGDGQVGSGIDKSLSERGVKMIYSAHIEMQTLSYEQAVEDIAALVERSGAYFEQKNFSNYSSGYRHASYTVRVPAEQFADFCAQVGTPLPCDVAGRLGGKYQRAVLRHAVASGNGADQACALAGAAQKGGEYGGHHHHRVRHL